MSGAGNRRKSIKEMPSKRTLHRSGTMLLGNIKEINKREDRVGVVPKDLGFNLIKDLIDFDEEENNRSKKSKYKPSSKLSREKTFK